MTGPVLVGDRSAQLAANLSGCRHRISVAARAAGRDPHSIHLVAVTKTWPADDVRRLAALGVTDVGENRDQEAAPKAAACADLGLHWHLVGQLQRNKARSVATYADMVHSVDRERLVEALGDGAVRAGRRIVALVQVSLDAVPTRGGAPVAEVRDLADLIAAREGLVLGGVMAVAPREGDPRAAFDRLVAVAEQLRADHPQAGVVSAGMSGDLEAAVAAGATHLRIGAALLGLRPALG